VTGVPQSKFGLTYQPLDHAKIAALPETDQAEVARVQTANNQGTLARVAVLPAIMFLCYLGLLLYFKSRGGYRPVQIHAAK
jgi:MFS transporter, DHA2 family, metal-tetracycline-proton antiporter